MSPATERWRSFVAVPIQPRTRTRLAKAVRHWRLAPEAPDLRWTDPQGWHLTLAFLGGVPPAEVPALAQALRGVEIVAPFSVTLRGVGAFPRPGAAQSVWVGIDDPDHRLTALADRVREAVLPGDPPARFRPHLTLGRSRVRRGEPMGPWLSRLETPSLVVSVRTVVLFRSHLGHGPARYEALATTSLGGGGSAHG